MYMYSNHSKLVADLELLLIGYTCFRPGVIFNLQKPTLFPYKGLPVAYFSLVTKSH